MEGGNNGSISCAADGGDFGDAMEYRIGGIFALLGFSTIGFFLPFVLGSFFKVTLFLFRSFAAGVVLATALVHILPDADNVLKNPCLGLSKEFPWASVFAVHAIIITFALEKLFQKLLIGSNKHVQGNRDDCELPVSVVAPEAKSSSDVCKIEEEVMVHKYRASAFTLEAGIIFHSIFIGISFGATKDVKTLQGLMIAIVFHQAFEGISLGILFKKAEVSRMKAIILAVAFVLTTPLGITVGIGIGKGYNENSKVTLILEGFFNSLSAGILIYNGLVDLLVPAFEEKDPDAPPSALYSLLGYGSILLGSGSMSLLAKWA